LASWIITLFSRIIDFSEFSISELLSTPRVDESVTLEAKGGTPSFKTSGTNNLATQCNNPEDQNPQGQHCDNLKSCFLMEL